jgi:hypothetical protein
MAIVMGISAKLSIRPAISVERRRLRAPPARWRVRGPVFCVRDADGNEIEIYVEG